MTAAPSPAWLALQLGELLAQRPAQLSDAHRRALDYTAAVHRTAGTGLDLALRCDSFDLLGDHELREALRRQLDVCIDGKARAEARIERQERTIAQRVDQLDEAVRQIEAWERRDAHMQEERAYLYDRLAELDPAYAATKASIRATLADPARMAWLREQETRLNARLADLDAATPGAVSADHPATSRAAAESVAQSAKMERLRVLASVIEDGPASASVIAQRLGLVPNQVAARAWELRKGDWLEWQVGGTVTETGEPVYVTDVTPHGRAGNVLFLTEHGRAELVREHGTLEMAAKLLREGRTA